MVDDLRLAEEILPLFDYTRNEEASAALAALLARPLPTVAAVRERQQVIQALLAHWAVLGRFGYQRLAFREVRTLLRDVAHGRQPLPARYLGTVLRHFVAEADYQRLRGRLTQLVQFLAALDAQYLAPLPPAAFPPAYAQQLTAARGVLAPLHLAEHAAAVQAGRFGPARVLALSRALRTLDGAALDRFWQFLFEFEALWSVARTVQERGFCWPRFADGGGLALRGLYHPAVPDAVPNTLTLAPGENVVLLTGPNMAGKSTLLKAVGLSVYLAHLGFGVPAAACTLPFFSRIVVAINLQDNLASGYSHFLTELLNLKAALEHAAGPDRCFAVFDELFRGTNPDDALRITAATLRGLPRFARSVFLVSSHLLQLEAELPALPAVCPYHLDGRLEQGRPVFSYQLRRGWSRLQFGQVLFEHLGLPALLATGDSADAPG